MPQALLSRTAEKLARKFEGVFSAQTVERYVFESYTALRRTAKVTTHLTTLALRFATDRLIALAQSQGAIAKDVPEVLFLCVRNAGRSQMAAALLNHHAQGRVHVRSAGSAPTHAINPVVVAVMTELGIELGQGFPKPLTDDVVAAADCVVSMGCGDACAIYPARSTSTGPSPTPDLATAALNHRLEKPVASDRTSSDKRSVLFVCVHNAGRSQMAAAFLTHLGGGEVEVRSAGSLPGDQVNPSAVAAMAEVGIDISQQSPKILTPGAVQASDVVITMGCGDACPTFPGKLYLDWALADPAGQDVDAVRPIRDEIQARVEALLAELLPDGNPAPLPSIVHPQHQGGGNS